MTVSIVRNSSQNCEPFCPQWIAAEGVITPETPKLFAAALTRLDGHKPAVAFDSPGGDFDAALEIGRLIREHGLDTVVIHTGFNRCSPESSCKPTGPSGFYKGFPMATAAPRCNGACLFAAMAGVKLTLGMNDYTLHHPSLYQSRGDKRAPDVQLMLYLAKMGVDKELLARMHQLGPSEQLVLDRKLQAKYLRAITDYASIMRILMPSACRQASLPAYCIKSAPGT